MNQPQHPIKAYTRATHTVAKTRQVVMLYDGAIRSLKQAAEAIVSGAIEERYFKLTRASEIINGLQNSLDFEVGGQTAQILYDFYASIDARIVTLHRLPNAGECERIVSDLKAMRDVWYNIDRAKDGGELPPMPPEATPPQPDGSVKVSA